MTIEAINMQAISKLLDVIGAERSEDNDRALLRVRDRAIVALRHDQHVARAQQLVLVDRRLLLADVVEAGLELVEVDVHVSLLCSWC